MALLRGAILKGVSKSKISFKTPIKYAEYTIGQKNGHKYFQLKTSSRRISVHHTQNLQLDHDAAIKIRDILDRALKSGQL